MTSGRVAFEQLVTTYRTAFPDLRVPVHGVLVGDGLLAARWTVTGTHHGPLLGHDPTGRPLSIPGQWFLHLHEGRIAEEWVSYDALDMLRQLGLPMPPG